MMDIEDNVYDGGGAGDSDLTQVTQHPDFINFIASVMGDESDAQILRNLKRTRDPIVRNDLTIEITPETAEDTYGGWWVSFYSVRALDAARATPKEINEITVAKSSVAASASTQPADVDPYAWRQNDISRARPAQAGSVSGGQVYVRGFYRKNGTYVRSYTRSAPGYGHHR